MHVNYATYTLDEAPETVLVGRRRPLCFWCGTPRIRLRLYYVKRDPHLAMAAQYRVWNGWCQRCRRTFGYAITGP